MNVGTKPRQAGWEQRQEDKPWYTPPGHYGAPESQTDVETRQYRNVVRTWQELKLSKHPLTEKDPAYRFVFQTPKYRWGAPPTAVASDGIAMLFGPFGDPYRRDLRTPWTGEAYAEINPRDAKELGLKDGDYMWLDADPEDRPYRGADSSDDYFEVARAMLRVRIYSGMPRGVIRTWFNMYAATPGTVQAQKDVPGGPAQNPDTGYVSLFRHGSHPSGRRAYLRPPQMTDPMNRKGAL